MKIRIGRALALAFVVLLAVATASRADEEAIRVVRATRVLNEMKAGGGLSGEVINGAHAVAIIPDVVKVAFVAGGRHGSGVLVRRTDDGGWSGPVFISLTGASLGLQLGAQSMDVVLVFRTDKNLELLSQGKFTIGADAAVAAGPVGKRGEHKTDVKFGADILSYSRTRGVFAGVSFDGAGIVIDDKANEAYYGKKGTRAEDIFSGAAVKESEATDELRDALGR